MQYRITVGLLLSLFFTLVPTPSLALVAGPSNEATVKTDSPFIITNYAFTASRLNYIQIYNSADEALRLDGWTVSYRVDADEITVPVSLSGFVAPHRYTLVADQSLGLASPFEYAATAPGPGDTHKITAVQLSAPDDASYLSHTVTTPTITANTLKELTTPPTYYIQRNVSTSTGNYLSSLGFFVPQPDFVLFMDPLYELPPNLGIEIREIVARARACSPLDTAPDCFDYVKLYNPTLHSIDLAPYRLRSGYLGQASTASNTFELNGMVAPGHYAAYPVSLTNSGGWLWFEDIYGLYRYDATVIEYPDASSETKQGQAWSYDERDGIWKWTSTPTPYDVPNTFPAPEIGDEDNDESTLKPCASNQYRNPETNRCRLLQTHVSVSSCREGQLRSAETNRCRRVVGSSVPTVAHAVQSMKETGKAFVGWWALGGVGMLAAGYAIWEWRQEITLATRKVINVFTSGRL